MSRGLRRCLGSGKGGETWPALVGYSLSELQAHMERQFLKGMNWQNMGEWHIDHIVPFNAFEVTSSADAGFRQAWALTNLRPCWAADNIRKSNKRTFLV